MISIDTDVLGVYHVFTRDARYPMAESFLEESRGVERGTTVFNLHELCGILATMGRKSEARTLFHEYLRSSDVEVLYPHPRCATLAEYWGEQDEELLVPYQSNPCTKSKNFRTHFLSATNLTN